MTDTAVWTANTALNPPPRATVPTAPSAAAVPNTARDPLSQSKRPRACREAEKNEPRKEARRITAPRRNAVTAASCFVFAFAAIAPRRMEAVSSAAVLFS